MKAGVPPAVASLGRSAPETVREKPRVDQAHARNLLSGKEKQVLRPDVQVLDPGPVQVDEALADGLEQARRPLDLEVLAAGERLTLDRLHDDRGVLGGVPFEAEQLGSDPGRGSQQEGGLVEELLRRGALEDHPSFQKGVVAELHRTPFPLAEGADATESRTAGHESPPGSTDGPSECTMKCTTDCTMECTTECIMCTIRCAARTHIVHSSVRIGKGRGQRWLWTGESRSEQSKSSGECWLDHPNTVGVQWPEIAHQGVAG